MHSKHKSLIPLTIPTSVNYASAKYAGWYLGITTRDRINHLLDQYGKITPAVIEECKCRMNEPIDSTQPIDISFQRIDDCVQYADVGRVEFKKKS
jgi:hypothetical protein